MTLKTKRWCDEILISDGWRILICCYRPRGLPKNKETWDVWFKQLGPSPSLHAQAYGKRTKPISWQVYTTRYFKEMKKKETRDLITCLAKILESGTTITLLCSSACINPEHCHRTLLKKLLEIEVLKLQKRNK